MSLPGGMKIKKAQIAGRVVYWKKHNLRNGSSFGGLFVIECSCVYGSISVVLLAVSASSESRF